MRPDDPVFSGQLAYDGMGFGESSDELIQYGHAGRVQFQRQAAGYIGCAFGDVAALRRYARVFTRQEMWDSYGRDYARDARAHELKIGYYFSHASGNQTGADGYFYDGIDVETGNLIPASPEHIAELEAIDAIKVVPDDWMMPNSAEWPSWEFVDRFDPRGVPVLIAEEL